MTFKLPEPVGCGYVFKYASGDTPSLQKEGWAQVTGMSTYTHGQLIQALRDWSEECAALCEGLSNSVRATWREDEFTEKAYRSGVLEIASIPMQACANAIREKAKELQ